MECRITPDSTVVTDGSYRVNSLFTVDIVVLLASSEHDFACDRLQLRAIKVQEN